MPNVLPSREKEWQLAQVGWRSRSKWLPGSRFLQAPADERDRRRGQRLDEPFSVARGHQRNVAIEDRRPHRVLGDLNRDMSLGDQGGIPLRYAGDHNRCRFRGSAFPYRGPGLGSGFQVWASACSGVSAGGALVEETVARIGLADWQVFPGRTPANLRAIPENDSDFPGVSGGRGIAPQEPGREYLRRKDRAFLGVVDTNRGQGSAPLRMQSFQN